MQQLPDPAESRVVLIGAAEYETLPSLKPVAQNLLGIRNVLCDPELWGLPAEACTVVPDPQSAVDIVDPVSEAARVAQDTLLVYYAGHGLLDSDSPDLHLALRQSREFQGFTALSYQHVRQAVMRSPARRRVIVLDCCYSGRVAHPLMGGHASGDDGFAQVAVVEGTYVLTSSARDAVSLAPQGEMYTAFTGELLSILRDGIPNGPDLIDLETLFTHLDRRLRARDRPAPQRCNHNTAGLLPLVRNRARTAQPGGTTSAQDVAGRAAEVGLRLAGLLRDAGRVREAVQILTVLWRSRSTEEPPADLALPVELARLLRDLNQVAEAVGVLRNAYEHVHAFPVETAGQVALAYARLLRESGDYLEACDVLEAALEASLGGTVSATEATRGWICTGCEAFNTGDDVWCEVCGRRQRSDAQAVGGA